MKTQSVRLFDVFALGPLMIWVADRTRGHLPTWARVALLISGQLTIAYNAENYLRQKGRHHGEKEAQEVQTQGRAAVR